MTHKRPRSPTPPPPPSTTISRSPPLHDRNSKFLALYSPTLPPSTLQSHPSTTGATHRILAWRRPSTQRSLKTSAPLIESSYDDDGERYGGKAVAGVLESLGVEGAVVVARWYGGVMLGPVRFEHMRSCARAAVLGWRSEEGEGEGEGRGKKVLREEEQRAKLEQTLRERDESIIVLRGLLAEKKGQASSQGSVSGSPARGPDYGKLPLQALKRLEEVRDATIGWILKSIEDAEKQSEEASTVKEADQRNEETSSMKEAEKQNDGARSVTEPERQDDETSSVKEG